MAISSTHNLEAMKAGKTSFVNSISEAKTMEKLTSDGRVGQTKDIAASLEISERMRRQFGGTKQSALTAQEDTSFSRAVDGALAKVSKMRHQINGLSVIAAGDTSSASDRQAIQQEIHQLLNEIDRIRDSAQVRRQFIFKEADADGGAEEMVKKANSNILRQPTQSMLTQANQEPNFVMQLLQ